MSIHMKYLHIKINLKYYFKIMDNLWNNGWIMYNDGDDLDFVFQKLLKIREIKLLGTK